MISLNFCQFHILLYEIVLKIKNIKTTLKTNTIDVDNQIMMQIGTAARVLRSNKASKIIFANVKRNKYL